MSTATSIEDILRGDPLSDSCSEEELKEKDKDELITSISDGDKKLEYRVKALEELEQRDRETSDNVIIDICAGYVQNPTSMIEEMLKNICERKIINIQSRYTCTQYLYMVEEITGYEYFLLLSKEISCFATPLQINILKILLTRDEHYLEITSLLENFLTRRELEEEFKYKTILSLQREKRILSSYIEYCYISVLKTFSSRYKILSSQYLFKNETTFEEAEKVMISIATDDNLDYNIRADSADLLIRSGTENGRSIGRDVITALGRKTGILTTLYTDEQNVHHKEVDESIRENILYLSSLSSADKQGRILTYEEIDAEIREYVIDYPEELKDKVGSSLLRIALDQAIYPGSQTLQSIFLKVWKCIKNNINSETLQGRMIEELIDMADTCSSGHVSRIVNVLSGFEIEGRLMNLSISYRTQIKNNFLSEIQKTISELDVDKQGLVLDELMSSGGLENKPQLKELFLKSIYSVKERLYQEFKDYLSSEEFEEHFRYAVVAFETGG